MKTLNQKGFGIIEIILLVVFVGVFVGAGGYVWHKNQSAKNANASTSSRTTTQKKYCSEKAGLRLCVTRQTESLSYTESTTLRADITNNSGKKYSTTFNCTYTGPYLVINGKEQIGQVCGQAITGVTISKGETKTYKIDLHGANLTEGENLVKLGWADLITEDMYFEQPASTSKDSAKLNSCYGSEDQAYCASMAVIVKEGNYSDNTTCDDLLAYFSKLNLKPDTKMCGLANSGEIFFSVPRNEADAWKLKLSDIPQVQEVSIL